VSPVPSPDRADEGGRAVDLLLRSLSGMTEQVVGAPAAT